MRRYVKKALGVVLVIVGFLALVTPFSPGSWLILIGFELLGLRFLLEDKLPDFLRLKPNSRLRRLLKRTMRKPSDSDESPRAPAPSDSNASAASKD
jgi:hypothetical protein